MPKGEKNLLKRFLLSFFLAILLLAIPSVALADSWSHYIEFTVSDNSSTDRTALPIFTGINTQNLIDAGYLDSSGNVTNMKESSLEREYGVATGNITLFIPNLFANQTKIYRFYMNYLPSVAYKIILGEGGYITITDDPSIELSDNFTIEISLFIKAVSNNILIKTSAITITYNAATFDLTVVIGGTTTLNATIILTGEQIITIRGDNSKFYLDIDGVNEDWAWMP